MNIIVGKTAGFCFGVNRAVEGSYNVFKDNDKKIYCLGELVHNRRVIKDLSDLGITFIDNVSLISDTNSKVIIRAHGISKSIYDELNSNNIDIVDYTCPFVLKIHDIVSKYPDYYRFVVGDSKHPETIGTVSYCGDNYSIIESIDDLDSCIDKYNKSNINKLLVVVQTTYSESKFNDIVNYINNNLSGEVIIKNTICSATSKRQEETNKLSKNVDCMIIIGGKNSSNTKKLYDIASGNCSNTLLIEDYSELDLSCFNDFDTIGIMAGASTPKVSIDEVVNYLKKNNL